MDLKLNSTCEPISDAMKRLSKELRFLRAMAGVSQDQLASSIGICRPTYVALEGRKRELSRKNFLLLLFFFENNSKTHDRLHELGLFPAELLLEINREGESD